MENSSRQIKLNLSSTLKTHLEKKSKHLGVPVTHYIRYLILSDLEEKSYPTFQLSDKAEKAYQAAKKDEQAGKLSEVEDLDKFFDEL